MGKLQKFSAGVREDKPIDQGRVGEDYEQDCTMGIAKLNGIVLAGLLALSAGGVRAGESATPATTPTSEPEVTLALVDPDDKVTVWQAMRLQVTLVNGSLPAGVGVTSLKVSIPRELELSPREVELISDAIELNAGARRDFPPVELASQPARDVAFASLITYRPRKVAFVATLKYESLADKRSATRTSKLVLPARAHPIGMYAGGLLGSLLAALFLILPPVRIRGTGPQAQTPPAGPALTALDRLRELGVRFVRGTVVTAIVILLLQTTTDVTLPINIAVQDFFGGVLLGLFGDKMPMRCKKKSGVDRSDAGKFRKTAARTTCM